MKKAQTQQIFIYLGALLVIGTLVVIGFQSTTQLMEQGCVASTTQFENDLLSTLDQNRGPGNFYNTQIDIPCGYQSLCVGTQPAPGSPAAVNTTLSVDTSQNIFLVDQDSVQHTVSYDDLADQPVSCISSSAGQADVVIEGQPRGKVSVNAP